MIDHIRVDKNTFVVSTATWGLEFMIVSHGETSPAAYSLCLLSSVYSEHCPYFCPEHRYYFGSHPQIPANDLVPSLVKSPEAVFYHMEKILQLWMTRELQN